MSENAEGFGGISALLQNPEIASRLPRIMEALAPVMAEMKNEKKEETVAAVADNAPSPPSENAAMALLSGVRSKGRSERYELLRALEPYLSDNRRQAMEYILKVASIIDILGEVM